MNEQIPVNLHDLYLIIGEKETLRFFLQREIEKQNQQIMEMSKEIESLRQQLNGKLEQSPDLDPIRRVPSGVQGTGLGFGPDVQGQSDESSSRDNPISSVPYQATGMGRVKLDRSTTSD